MPRTSNSVNQSPNNKNKQSPKKNQSRKNKNSNNGSRSTTSNEQDSCSAISRLPLDLWIRIFTLLDPEDLESCENVCQPWRSIISSDISWKAAFFTHFNLSQGEAYKLPARRLDPRSWRQEYSLRTNLIKQWGQNSGRVISYDPNIGPISTVHASFDINDAICTVMSLATERTAKSSWVNGRSIANHDRSLMWDSNIELDPQVNVVPSVVKINAEGNRVAWGLSNGRVQIFTYNKTTRESKYKLIRHSNSQLLEQFGETSITHIQFVKLSGNKELILTCCTAGFAKVWDISSPGSPQEPIWTSPRINIEHLPLTSRQYLSITAADIRIHGTNSALFDVVLALPSGCLRCFVNIDAFLKDNNKDNNKILSAHFQVFDTPQLSKGISTIVLDRPLPQFQQHGNEDEMLLPEDLSILIHKSGEPFIEKYQLISLFSKQVQKPYNLIKPVTVFDQGNKGYLGPITSLRTNFATSKRDVTSTTVRARNSPVVNLNVQDPKPWYHETTASPNVQELEVKAFGHCKFIVAGDALGNVFLWDWNSDVNNDVVANGTTTVKHIEPIRTFPNVGCKVTALDFSDLFILIGKENGAIDAYDVLEEPATFVRSFAEPSSVRQQARRRNRQRARARRVLGQERDVDNEPEQNDQDEQNINDPVSQIVSSSFGLVASIENRLLSWSIPLSSKFFPHNKSNNTKPNASNRYKKYYEMNKIIHDSQEMMRQEDEEEEKRLQRLDAHHGDLNFGDALEYALMLSREEQERKEQVNGVNGFTEPINAEQDEEDQYFATSTSSTSYAKLDPELIEYYRKFEGISLQEDEQLLHQYQEEERRRQKSPEQSTSASITQASPSQVMAESLPTPSSSSEPLTSPAQQAQAQDAGHVNSNMNEEEELRYAIELSLAEANSRNL